MPRDVREMYDRGLQYLAKTQSEQGDWQGGQQGPGITGMALMVFLASGEDPNFGPVQQQRPQGAAEHHQLAGRRHRHHGQRACTTTGSPRSAWPRPMAPWTTGTSGRTARGRDRSARPSSWPSAPRSPRRRRTRTAAWRYSPDASDADTSVSGAVFVGLLAARNAGIEVPDESINRAIAFYTSMTSGGGEVAYAGGLGGFGESLARSSIASLVYAVARRKDLKQYRATLDYLKQRLEQTAMSYPEYCRYYEAQALFQGDIIAWEKWNKLLIRQLKQAQQADGSIPGQFGNDVGTAMSLLALAPQLSVPADLRALGRKPSRVERPADPRSRPPMRRTTSILTSGTAAVVAGLRDGLRTGRTIFRRDDPDRGRGEGPAAGATGRGSGWCWGLSNQLRPFYRYELMHVRTACGLSKEQLQKIRPESDAAYGEAIARLDAARIESPRSTGDDEPDYQEAIRKAVHSVVAAPREPRAVGRPPG